MEPLQAVAHSITNPVRLYCIYILYCSTVKSFVDQSFTQVVGISEMINGMLEISRTLGSSSDRELQ